MLYLASQSPRRHALLTQMRVAFTVLLLEREGLPPKVQEIPRPNETPAAYVVRMARAKAIVGMRQLRQQQLHGHAVLGADTEVVLNHRIFGKPQDRSDARSMLHALAGRTHEVLTAIALRLPQNATMTPSLTLLRLVTTHVTFKALSEREIEHYLNSGEPFGKAGAYAIQGLGAAFVSHLEGSYTGVVGLPIFETMQLLSNARIHN